MVAVGSGWVMAASVTVAVVAKAIAVTVVSREKQQPQSTIMKYLRSYVCCVCAYACVCVCVCCCYVGSCAGGSSSLSWFFLLIDRQNHTGVFIKPYICLLLPNKWFSFYPCLPPTTQNLSVFVLLCVYPQHDEVIPNLCLGLTGCHAHFICAHRDQSSYSPTT